MSRIGGIVLKVSAAAVALSAFSAPALARDWHDRNRHEYRDDRYRDYDHIRLRGPGVGDLNPWFRNARSGREFAARRAGTHISRRDAWMLNREFEDQHDRRWDRRWR